MAITNLNSGTRIDEIAEDIYRIHTPISPNRFPGGFSFNQYLIVDEEPLLFHTGWRKLFPLVKEAIASVMPVERLRYIAFSHYEADECGALNEFLAIASFAVPLCGKIAAMTSIDDVADRPGRVLADGEELKLGKHVVRWLDTPHLPHGWECGYLFDSTAKTLLCGDLFTQGGWVHPPITEQDILSASEAMREKFDYFSHAPSTRELLKKLAATEPTTLACMHGAAWKGNGAQLLLALADELESSKSLKVGGSDRGAIEAKTTTTI
ncbi:MAG: MBL fold metallo-hydrolase [Prochloraceae cyanobacterium]|nr:MBL fold metallo-hydrolase [Prochloraceae cyanobacterium]